MGCKINIILSWFKLRTNTQFYFTLFFSLFRWTVLMMRVFFFFYHIKQTAHYFFWVIFYKQLVKQPKQLILLSSKTKQLAVGGLKAVALKRICTIKPNAGYWGFIFKNTCLKIKIIDMTIKVMRLTLWHMYDPPFFTLSAPDCGPVCPKDKKHHHHHQSS